MTYFLIIVAITMKKSQLSVGLLALNTHIPFKHKPGLRRNISPPVGILFLNMPLYIPEIVTLVCGEMQRIAFHSIKNTEVKPAIVRGPFLYFRINRFIRLNCRLIRRLIQLTFYYYERILY